jgi:hypothetical protein
MSETTEDIREKELDDYASRVVNQEVVEEVKQEEPPKLTPEQKEHLRQVFKGVRPEGMSQEMFKSIRTYLNRLNKARLKGNVVHQSVLVDDKGKLFGVTYKKDK